MVERVGLCGLKESRGRGGGGRRGLGGRETRARDGDVITSRVTSSSQLAIELDLELELELEANDIQAHSEQLQVLLIKIDSY